MGSAVKLEINLINNKMKDRKEDLVKAIVTYLNYDQITDIRFYDPSDRNRDHHLRIRKDAKRIANIAIRLLIREKKALPIHVVDSTFKDKHTPAFEEFMTNFCKHGITLTNNYTGETIGLKDLISKYKLTNNIKP